MFKTRMLMVVLAATAATYAVEPPKGGPAAPSGTGAVTSTVDTTPQSTPALRSIEATRKKLMDKPGNPQLYADLSMALSRRARETADASWYVRALEAADQSLSAQKDYFPALKARAWSLLGQHEFAQARELAQALNKRSPDDLQVYGFLVDANVELGNYKEAERAAQWMLDMRPGIIPGLTRAAYLREIYGDLEGSEQLLTQALQETPLQEAEDRALLLTHIAHLERKSGKHAEAERALNNALKIFPGYHYALGEMGELKLEQHQPDEAATLFMRRFQSAPHPENLYALAGALRAAGRMEQAQDAYARFERMALSESSRWDNANRELIIYYAGEGKRPDEALRLARLETGRRKDIPTLLAYEKALEANGQADEVKAVEQQVALAIAK
jgi:tetratricopeptide (TPR) repeat protein